MQELRGMPVVNSLAEKFKSDIERLKGEGIVPKLTVVRVGEQAYDLAYEKGIMKRFYTVSAIAEVIALPVDVSQEELEQTILNLNEETSVHGILLFRPLPKNLSEDRIKSIIAEGKDVDGMGINNIAHVFSGKKSVFRHVPGSY